MQDSIAPRLSLCFIKFIYYALIAGKIHLFAKLSPSCARGALGSRTKRLVRLSIWSKWLYIIALQIAHRRLFNAINDMNMSMNSVVVRNRPNIFVQSTNATNVRISRYCQNFTISSVRFDANKNYISDEIFATLLRDSRGFLSRSSSMPPTESKFNSVVFYTSLQCPERPNSII